MDWAGKTVASDMCPMGTTMEAYDASQGNSNIFTKEDSHHMKEFFIDVLRYGAKLVREITILIIALALLRLLKKVSRLWCRRLTFYL